MQDAAIEGLGPSPFSVRSRLNLVDMGVPAKALTFASVSLQKNGLVCAIDKDSKTVTIVDCSGNGSPSRHLHLEAESALVCPDGKLLAVKNKRILTVIDLQEEQELTATEFDGDVDYIKWYTSDKLLIVTRLSVLRWDLRSTPSLILARPKDTLHYQVVDVAVSRKGQVALSMITAKVHSRL